MKQKDYYKIIALAFLLLLNQPISFSQTSSDTIKFGGLGVSGSKEVVLEKANLGVYYQFTQKATENKKTITVSDTLLLAIGSSHSLFFDQNYKTNFWNAAKARRERSMKTRKANFQHEYLDEILELVDETSDFQEESLGEPVQIYKNREEGTVSSVYNSSLENFITEQKVDKINNWKIINEKDTVFNYSCQKAITTYAGRTYTAWFTMDIPINEGPWKFCNLPGLILKVTDDENLFQYLAIGLEQYEGNREIIKDETEYEKASLKNLNSYVSKEKSKPVVTFYSKGTLYMTHKKSPITFNSMEKL